MPAKSGPKPEPLAPNLIASLRHPDSKANLLAVGFSPDGARLFTADDESGVVQLWDVASRKEIRRINTPKSFIGTFENVLLTPDWKTFSALVRKRSVKTFERDGKKLHRIEYAGEIRSWDVPSGKEKEPLRSEEGWAPRCARLAPGGQLLVCAEWGSYDIPEGQSKARVVVWDLTTRKMRKLSDWSGLPIFSLDGKTFAVGFIDQTSNRSAVKLIDLATGKELAEVKCPEKDRFFFDVDSVSPDGSVFLVSLGGKKGSPVEVWFLDARTLEQRGKLIGKGDPEGYGGSYGRFTPDGRMFVLPDWSGKALLWNVAQRKVERTVPLGDARPGWPHAISPDGKTFALGWHPKGDPELEGDQEPDPKDWPQPRVSLIDLTGKRPPRVLVAPHGFDMALAFSPDGKTLAFGSTGAVHLFDLTR